MPNFGIPDRDLLDRINRLEATVNELSRAHGAPITAIRDINGSPLVQTDPVTGVGLQRPYVPIPFARVHWMDWPKSSGTPSEAIPWVFFKAQTVKQHPAVIMTVGGICTGSTTGRLQVTLNGDQVWPDLPIIAGVEQFFRIGPIAIPGEYLAPLSFRLQGVMDTSLDANSALYANVQEAYGVELRDPFPLPS